MKIIVLDNYNLLSARAADLVMAALNDKPDSNIGLATGRTTLGMYQELVEAYVQGEVSFCGLRAFMLDEFVGLGKDDHGSFGALLQNNFFNTIDVRPENIYWLDGATPDPQFTCEDYERIISELGGIDLQILGIGQNGHIGFNEPGTSFETKTHVVELRETTRQNNAHFFAGLEAVPRQAITLGLATIMSAKRIMLLASGAHKQRIIKIALQGPITEKVPASILQKHKNLIVLLDKAASF